MSFAAPLFLLGLLLVPLALAAEAARRRRARRYAVRFTAVPALRAAVGAEPAWRRRLPAALALAAVAVLVLAMAKPQRTVAVPVERGSIVLVTDHSRSMLAADVEPDRLGAAKAAARAFIAKLPRTIRLGAVAYSDAPDALQAPSSDHSAARTVIERQRADGGTATGEALAVALRMLAPGGRDDKRPPAAIVLLSDGATTVGRDPVAVAGQARRLGIPIYTVALGTTGATVPSPGFGPPLPVPPDPETLARIASTSNGKAFAAEDDQRLASIYKTLGSRLGTRSEKREITTGFAAGGLALLLAAAAASVRLGGRLP